MAKTEGQMWKCERCGKEIFLKRLEIKYTDGGFTQQPIYEEKPNGWGVYCVGSSWIELCQECGKEHKRMCELFMKQTEEV